MSTWKKVAVLNFGGLLGIALSMFLVPPSTPLWLWAVISALCLALMNYFLVVQLRKPRTPGKTTNLWSNGALLFGFVLLVAELLARFWHH